MNRITTGIVALFAITYLSCTRSSDTLPIVNGYSMGGIVYKMDSMSLNSPYVLRVWSGDHGGSSLTLQRFKPWPSLDGTYDLDTWLPSKDSNGVGITFQHDTSSAAYYSVAPAASPLHGLVYKVERGKKELQLSSLSLRFSRSKWTDDSQDLDLRITAKE